MNIIQEEVIDNLFFIVSYDELLESVSCSEKELVENIEKLLNKKLINQYQFDDAIHDYKELEKTDFDQIPDYAYLANKDGLLKYTLGE